MFLGRGTPMPSPQMYASAEQIQKIGGKALQKTPFLELAKNIKRMTRPMFSS